MRKLDAPQHAPQRLRARRWDAVILGSALPGLIAGTRLALGKKRVLLVEEENAARGPGCLREPFLIPMPPDGVLDRCLRALGMPLIDRRRLLPQATAYQVILPDGRIDTGDAALTAQELVAWGLAKPEIARSWVEEVERGAGQEREQILASPFVRFGGLRDLARGVVRPRSQPRDDQLAEWHSHSPALRGWAESQVLGLREHADRTPPVGAQLRLLAAPLEGCAGFATGDESLTGLFRSRFQALHGEIRLLGQPFELVTADGAAAIHPRHSSELWVGRALILNTSATALRRWLVEAGQSEPDFLPESRGARRRVYVRIELHRDELPEGMARRVIDATDPSEGAEPVRIAWNPSRAGKRAEMLASTVAPEAIGRTARRELEERILDRVRALMPFAEDRVVPRPNETTPRWDDATVLEDPIPGSAWPDEIPLRLVSRPPVYRLPREASGALGTEGDCLLGWRAGEAILGELG